MNDQLPEHEIAAGLEAVEDRWVLRFERELPHPRSVVWAALTNPDRIRHWAPFDPARPLTATGEVALPEIGDPDSPTTGVVLQADEESGRLRYAWDADELAFQLSDVPRGTRLVMTHRFATRDSASSYAAGWHLCLAALHAVLDGADVPPVAGEAAKARGWQQLRDAYEAVLLAR